MRTIYAKEERAAAKVAEPAIPPAAEYARLFALECQQDYPQISAFEERTGYAVDRVALERAARVLACPVKAHPPNWQHGRVLYALARKRLAELKPGERPTLLDIGTAKGFSALCLLWALEQSGVKGRIASVDILDPKARVRRNTVAECDGFVTLAETLAPWPEAAFIDFEKATGIEWLQREKGVRLPVVFVDGKHKYDNVRREATLIARLQKPGDVILFDDCQIEQVALAVRQMVSWYRLETIPVHGHRISMVAVRR
jgi:predicted O-methyltransferase YrrM